MAVRADEIQKVMVLLMDLLKPALVLFNYTNNMSLLLELMSFGQGDTAT